MQIETAKQQYGIDCETHMFEDSFKRFRKVFPCLGLAVWYGKFDPRPDYDVDGEGVLKIGNNWYSGYFDLKTTSMPIDFFESKGGMISKKCIDKLRSVPGSFLIMYFRGEERFVIYDVQKIEWDEYISDDRNYYVRLKEHAILKESYYPAHMTVPYEIT